MYGDKSDDPFPREISESVRSQDREHISGLMEGTCNLVT